jgi:hypothetical protein
VEAYGRRTLGTFNFELLTITRRRGRRRRLLAHMPGQGAIFRTINSDEIPRLQFV